MWEEKVMRFWEGIRRIEGVGRVWRGEWVAKSM